MIRINLLPYRAERRRRKKIQFSILCVLSLLAGLFVFVVGMLYLDGKISHQEARNDYLTKEIAVLDRQIKEIEKLKKETNALIERKKVVESLQRKRSDVVHLLDQVLRILPDDVYLKNLEQKGNKISVNGLAQTNARVSTLMRAIDSSPWLDAPRLIEIKSTTVNSVRLSAFKMTFNLKDKKSGAADNKDDKG